MPLQIKIPNADFSASAMPKFIPRVAGFDVPLLEALYLFEDGTVNSAQTIALDSSGKGKHGSLLSGSLNPIKTATGYDNNIASTAAAGDFLFETGIDLSGEKTIFVCSRSDLVSTSGLRKYLTVMTSKATVPMGTGVAQNASSPLLTLNRLSADIASDSATTNTDSGFYVGSGVVGNAWENGIGGSLTNARPTLSSSPFRATQGTYSSAVFSISNANKRIRFVTGISSNSSLDGVEPAYVTALQTQTIKFGVAKNANEGANGEIGIAGIYSKESTVAEMRDIITKMQTRMALRGVTLY